MFDSKELSHRANWLLLYLLLLSLGPFFAGYVVHACLAGSLHWRFGELSKLHDAWLFWVVWTVLALVAVALVVVSFMALLRLPSFLRSLHRSGPGPTAGSG